MCWNTFVSAPVKERGEEHLRSTLRLVNTKKLLDFFHTAVTRAATANNLASSSHGMIAVRHSPDRAEKHWGKGKKQQWHFCPTWQADKAVFDPPRGTLKVTLHSRYLLYVIIDLPPEKLAVHGKESELQ